MEKKRTFVMAFCCALCLAVVSGQEKSRKEQVEQAMFRATRYMVEEVGRNGGFVWNYLPDFSRQWGEMEASPGMIWFQPPGTPSMGQVFLDAYHATGDEYYYRAAEQVARILVRYQLECGGWNYVAHTEGEDSLKKWYVTIGKNGWRLEEYRHYYGNATFDDDATFAPASFLLRIFLEKRDSLFLPPLRRAMDFVLESQYPVGGWPQRYPPPAGAHSYPDQPHGDYPSYITLNDGVHRNNVLFLMNCYRVFHEERLHEAFERAMRCIPKLRRPLPQPGWSWQHTTDLEAAGARSYEPEGLYTGATYHCINLLMDYYTYSGDRYFLTGIHESIDYLESLALPAEIASLYPRTLKPGQKVYPSCVERGSNRPLFVHRRGSNTANGCYYADYNPGKQWMPTFSMRALDTGILRERYRKLPDSMGMVREDTQPVPAYFFRTPGRPDDGRVDEILQELELRPYWEGVFAGSHPYAGEGTKEAGQQDYSCTQVGDRYDTSPYRFGEAVRGISTRVYIENMSVLMAWLESFRDQQPDQ